MKVPLLQGEVIHKAGCCLSTKLVASLSYDERKEEYSITNSCYCYWKRHTVYLVENSIHYSPSLLTAIANTNVGRPFD